MYFQWGSAETRVTSNAIFFLFCMSENLRKELQAQIKAILEPHTETPHTAGNMCLISDQEEALSKCRHTNGDFHKNKLQQKGTSLPAQARKEPVESNDLGEDNAQDVEQKENTSGPRNRQNSFIRPNLDSRSSEKETVYGDKNISCNSLSSNDNNISISNEQSQHLPNPVHTQDNGASTPSSYDEFKKIENHKGPEITLSGNLSEGKAVSNGVDEVTANTTTYGENTADSEACSNVSTAAASSDSNPSTSGPQESDPRERGESPGVDDSPSSLSSASLSVIFRVVDLYLSWK